MSSQKFKTEVNQLLHLIIHSLYSHKEIFLRELVSNSSDAMDKLRFLSLTDDSFKDLIIDPRIDITIDSEKGIIEIADNGIGMDENEIAENLGTIARSGTRHFIDNMTGDQKKDSNLIGQFGVGFYSSFMVADKVEVNSRKVGSDKACLWSSDGKTGYEISETTRNEHGTTVTLHVNSEGTEYTHKWQLETIVKKYSNHVPFPIFLHFDDIRHEGEGDDRKEIREKKVEQINSALALWKKPKSEISQDDYDNFYTSISHDTEKPLLHIHTQAEGTLDYTTLLYIPSKAPFDLFRVDYNAGVKLYVKRVFITDDEKELMPVYLRFLRGIIDSEDLPLNVSREMLQENRVLAKIRTNSVKKVLSELENLKTSDRDKYNSFYTEFGIPVKEGLYQDYANRDKLMELVMFRSTTTEGFSTLAEYVERMGENQKAIYFITGRKEQNLKASPLLEMYLEKGVEVLVMDDEIDEVVMSGLDKYKNFDIKSVQRSDAADDLQPESSENNSEMSPLAERMKNSLGELVKEVKTSFRLKESPACIVVDSNDPTSQMQKILKAMGHAGVASVKPILEINPEHTIIRRMSEMADDEKFTEISSYLLDQAKLSAGMEIDDLNAFLARSNRLLSDIL
jgi:molecular chaperone HtpG